MFANLKKCAKMFAKKNFLWGGKNKFLFSRIVGKFIFVLYSHPLLAIGNREGRVALYCGQYTIL